MELLSFHEAEKKRGGRGEQEVGGHGNLLRREV